MLSGVLYRGLQVKGSEAWYLPEDSRPEGTVQYKDRALQTPLVAADGYSWLRIALPDKPDATALNFVLKVSPPARTHARSHALVVIATT